MLDYISGKVVSLTENTAVIDVGGIGFFLQVPKSAREHLSQGEVGKLYSVMSIKNEEPKLYGFVSSSERVMFEKLQSVSGIGPAMAMNIVSSSSLEELYSAILQEDLSLFKKIKGVGVKTAKRIILELKATLEKEGPMEMATPTASIPSTVKSDTIAALLSLGHTYEVAWQAVNKAQEKIPQESSGDLELLLKEALAELH